MKNHSTWMKFISVIFFYLLVALVVCLDWLPAGLAGFVQMSIRDSLTIEGFSLCVSWLRFTSGSPSSCPSLSLSTVIIVIDHTRVFLISDKSLWDIWYCLIIFEHEQNSDNKGRTGEDKINTSSFDPLELKLTRIK